MVHGMRETDVPTIDEGGGLVPVCGLAQCDTGQDRVGVDICKLDEWA